MKQLVKNFSNATLYKMMLINGLNPNESFNVRTITTKEKKLTTNNISQLIDNKGFICVPGRLERYELNEIKNDGRKGAEWKRSYCFDKNLEMPKKHYFIKELDSFYRKGDLRKFLVETNKLYVKYIVVTQQRCEPFLYNEANGVTPNILDRYIINGDKVYLYGTKKQVFTSRYCGSQNRVRPNYDNYDKSGFDICVCRDYLKYRLQAYKRKKREEEAKALQNNSQDKYDIIVKYTNEIKTLIINNIDSKLFSIVHVMTDDFNFRYLDVNINRLKTQTFSNVESFERQYNEIINHLEKLKNSLSEI